jgi:hypothetical protein
MLRVDGKPMATLLSHPAKSLARLTALGLALAFLPGCQNIQTTVNDGTAIRFVAASPDSGGLDFFQNNTVLVYNVGFGTISSYVPTAPGVYTFSADSATADATGTRQTLISAKQTLTSPKQYTAIIGNIEADLQETIVTDQTTPAPTGQVAMRFIDQATHVGAVDIYIVPASGKLATSSPIATNVVFTGNTGYINVPAGTYAIAVVPTGTVPISTTVTLYTGASTSYSAGAVRTFILIDSLIVTTPAVQIIPAIDYDSPSATM